MNVREPDKCTIPVNNFSENMQKNFLQFILNGRFLNDEHTVHGLDKWKVFVRV